MAKAIAVLVLLLISPAAHAATTHIVGGDKGWTSGVDYVSWASGQNFTIGDTLLFNYDGITHAVYEVNEDDYNNCVDDYPKNVYTFSPTIIALSTVNQRYFICPRSNHCARGLKLEVTVQVGSTTPDGAPAPSTTPSPAPGIPSDTRDNIDDYRWTYGVRGRDGFITIYDYTELAATAFELKLIIGDTLSFYFDHVTNAVYEVSPEDYNECNNESPIHVYTSSPTRITLTTISPRYFISPRSNNCKLGQKLAITVSVRRAITPSRAPSPSMTGDTALGLVGPMS